MDNCKNEQIIQTANIHENNCKRKIFIFLERKTIINPRKIYNKTKLFPKSIEWGRAERLFPTDHPSGKAYAVKEKGTEGKILLKIKNTYKLKIQFIGETIIITIFFPLTATAFSDTDIILRRGRFFDWKY